MASQGAVLWQSPHLLSHSYTYHLFQRLTHGLWARVPCPLLCLPSASHHVPERSFQRHHLWVPPQPPAYRSDQGAQASRPSVSQRGCPGSWRQDMQRSTKAPADSPPGLEPNVTWWDPGHVLSSSLILSSLE